ncbi:MAG: CHASE2 domain-containing protein [Phycisphaerae bacterium]|nr:CHASE2 domain-containing protein [Phycisphaerae bacterium]
MSGPVSRTSHFLLATALGLAGATVVLLLHLAGAFERVELDALDLRFRHAGGDVPDCGLVHIDIDDGSLEKVGRWPWDRAKLAGMLTVLRDCGARTVAMDILLPDPQPPRYVASDPVRQGVGGPAAPQPAFDDANLRDAIASTDTVLPLVIDLDPPEASGLQRRATDALSDEPALPASRLAERLDAPRDAVEAIYPRAVTAAMNRRVADRFAAGRTPPSLDTVIAAVLPPTLQAGSHQRDALETAYLRYRSLRALERFALDGIEAEGLPGGSVAPPLVLFSQRAQAAGFVTAEPDVDGVVRRIRPLARGAGQTYPHFAVALARRALRRDGACAIRRTSEAILLRRDGDTLRRVPLDADGRMLIHWARGADERRHVPAAAVVAVHAERAKLAQLRQHAHATRMEILTLGVQLPDERSKALYWQLNEKRQNRDKARRARIAAQREYHNALLYRPDADPDPAGLKALRDSERALEQLEQQVHRTATELVAALRDDDTLAAFLGGPDGDDFAARRHRAAALLATLDAVPARRKRLRQSIKTLKAQIAERVEGRMCLIGLTATGAGGSDFVPTPVGPQTPGVYVHGRALETILSGWFVRRAGTWLDVLAIIAAGGVVALITAWRPILQAAAATLVLAAGYVGGNAWGVFGTWGVWLVVVAPLAAMAASFTAVTAYRQLTEERARRRIRAMFAHALSPELVDRLVADPSLAELGGQQRAVTCLFADLAGFTAMSQQLGPQGTVRVLNRFFDRVSEIVQARRGGYVNKFLGDGVFCLFGAPVDQPDHDARAINAGIDVLNAVAALNDADNAAGPRLTVRVGVAGGEAMVGNCGATNRMDYTAIGDCVNLASRLESANKFFGSAVLVTEQAWSASGCEDIVSRPLGRVAIVGVREPVTIREVLGRADAISPERRDAVAHFAEGLERFQRRAFADATERFRKAADAGDRPAQAYLRLAQAAAEVGDVEDWPADAPCADGVVRIVFPADRRATTSDG